MPPKIHRDSRLEADGVLVRPIGGQIYLIEEGAEEDNSTGEEDGASPERSPLSGLISRH